MEFRTMRLGSVDVGVVFGRVICGELIPYMLVESAETGEVLIVNLANGIMTYHFDLDEMVYKI